MSEDLAGLKRENQLDPGDCGTRTPNTDPSDNTKPNTANSTPAIVAHPGSA